MKTSAIFAFALGLIACTTPEDRQRAGLMDQIEKSVRLPEGARPLREYARHYAERDSRHVVGIYLVPLENKILPGESCEELHADFSSTPVPCEPMEVSNKLPAGERAWLDKPLELPFIADGGCAQVTVIFDKERSIVTSVACNGVA